MLTQVPYGALRDVLEAVRMRYYTVDWPDVDSVELAIDPADLEAELRRHHWEGLYLSYNYRGQVLELRRPAGVDDQGRPLEDHIRARRTERGLEVIAHREACRFEASEAHIKETALDWLEADEIRDLLEEALPEEMLEENRRES